MNMVPQGYRRPARSLPSWYSSPMPYTGSFEHSPHSQAHLRTKVKRRPPTPTAEPNRPHTIDIIGNGPETTICGHISLLTKLPLHHDMHRRLLETFKKKPGNYEGKYNDKENSKASVLNYGNGYLSIHFTDDITRPEMSEFLLAHNWKMMNAHCTTQNGRDMIYEKWTNVHGKKPLKSDHRQVNRIPASTPGRHY